MLPLAKLAVEAHALSDPEACDHAPLDLLAGLSGSFFLAGLVSYRFALTGSSRP